MASHPDIHDRVAEAEVIHPPKPEKACQSPAVKGNARCRMHGGKGSGAPKANRNAWKHGGRSADTRHTLELIRQLGRSLNDLDEGR